MEPMAFSQSSCKRDKPISGIVLAAGPSLRARRPKLLLPFGKKTLVELAIENLLEADLNELIVVIGAFKDQIETTITRYPVKVVYNPDYTSGMASSLRYGVASVSEKASGFLIALGDMPFIEPWVLRKLLEAFEKGARIVAPSYRGTRGHPVIFHKDYKGELLSLSGDEGAKKVIEKHQEELYLVEVDVPSVVFDIDTEEDYRKAKELFSHFEKVPRT